MKEFAKVPVKCSGCGNDFGWIEQGRLSSARAGASTIWETPALWRPVGADSAVKPPKKSVTLICTCEGPNGFRRYQPVLRDLAKEVIRDGFERPALLGLGNYGIPTREERHRQWDSDMERLRSVADLIADAGSKHDQARLDALYDAKDQIVERIGSHLFALMSPSDAVEWHEALRLICRQLQLS